MKTLVISKLKIQMFTINNCEHGEVTMVSQLRRILAFWVVFHGFMMIDLSWFTTKWNKWNINPQRYGISTNQPISSRNGLFAIRLRSGPSVDLSMEKCSSAMEDLQNYLSLLVFFPW